MNPFFYDNNLLLLLLTLWSIPWKIYAVWLAAKHRHKKWFVALIIFNTLSILELIYIFYILKKPSAEVSADFSKAFGWKKKK